MPFNFSKLPDPERARKNVDSFLSENPSYSERLNTNIEKISTLFSYSQFLANYCTQNPDQLFYALDNLDIVFSAEDLGSEFRGIMAACNSIKDGMRAARIFRKNKMLIVTLRDILRLAGQQEIMAELSIIADSIMKESLFFVEPFLKQKYGEPGNNSLVVLSLGKLGAEELNYSSDVDIMIAYKDDGETTGSPTMQGSTINRLSAFEYYTKLAEEYTRFLSANTEEGFVYRVDMRLRPQGQRGSLVLPLKSYEEYYESWGQLWEKAALLRARPVAGDMDLGSAFLNMIRPFVYRKYLDFQAIEELRRMKAQVEQIKPGTHSRDIKRGYGGIREIEFFIQVFQLIYGGKEMLLRERSTLKALHMLQQKGLIGYEDFRHLSENYIYFRTLEHRLQQVNDLQTHALPASEEELNVLAKKMGYSRKDDFLSDLNSRRLKVRSIYDSLLYYDAGASVNGELARAPSVLDAEYWDIDVPVEHLLSEELSRTGISDVRKAMHCLMKIRNNIYSFQTIKGRRLLEDIIPEFINNALAGPNPDRVLLQLVDFSGILAVKESYIESLAQRREIISALNFIFSSSEYLSKILMSNPEYIESLVEGQIKDKTLATSKNDLKHLIDRYGESRAVRLFRRLEEIRLGILFLNKKADLTRLVKALSRTADAVLSTMIGSSGLSIACFGKLGGRELNFNSDLDLIFITKDSPAEKDIRAAERLLKAAMSYTKEGMAYRIDTRLRPEGNKGPLVSSIRSLTEYYMKDAQGWELQALLKARPLFSNCKLQTANCNLGKLFMKMRREVFMKRGKEVTLAEIKAMRDRIRKELSKDRSQNTKGRINPVKSGPSTHYDIKLGPGGIEELEFAVQYLQLRHCHNNPDLLVQGTLDAIKRLGKKGFLRPENVSALTEAYVFFRTVEAVLRLRNETVLKSGSSTVKGVSDFMGLSEDSFIKSLEGKKTETSNFWNSLE